MITRIVKPVFAIDGSVDYFKTTIKFLGVPVYRNFSYPLRNDHTREYIWF